MSRYLISLSLLGLIGCGEMSDRLLTSGLKEYEILDSHPFLSCAKEKDNIVDGFEAVCSYLPGDDLRVMISEGYVDTNRSVYAVGVSYSISGGLREYLEGNFTAGAIHSASAESVLQSAERYGLSLELLGECARNGYSSPLSKWRGLDRNCNLVNGDIIAVASRTR